MTETLVDKVKQVEELVEYVIENHGAREVVLTPNNDFSLKLHTVKDPLFNKIIAKCVWKMNGKVFEVEDTLNLLYVFENNEKEEIGRFLSNLSQKVSDKMTESLFSTLCEQAMQIDYLRP